MSRDNIPDYRHLFNVLIIGDSGVGKSNLMSQWCNNKFNDNSTTTIGIDFTTKVLHLEQSNINVKLHIWYKIFRFFLNYTAVTFK